MSNTEKLLEVFRQVFGIATVSDKTTRDDIPEWNSLQTINLILALEEAFDVQLTPEDAAALLSVGLAKDILAKQGITF